MALSLGLVCSLRPSRSCLTARQPEQQLCMRKHFFMISMILLGLAGEYAIIVWYMTIQPWYKTDSDSDQRVGTTSSQPCAAVVSATSQPVLNSTSNSTCHFCCSMATHHTDKAICTLVSVTTNALVPCRTPLSRAVGLLLCARYASRMAPMCTSVLLSM